MSELETIRTTLEATAGETDEVKIQAIREAMKPSQGAVDKIWYVLVVGLVLVLIISVVAIWTLEGDNKTGTSASVAVTAFTTALSGLLGLFVTSPLDKGTG